ncbi:AMP-binding protein [Endozoicomonas gorgoniicola]|uniref:AMP-binding protein n=1 Tax=Endozoicomonas gorgoniicola TaxID=1234144 RepID=A0ABT3MZ22_9GAMM|nr:AMP-binding protein [Endozoicomonas gorgoniicola]MCW7554625.1 AMP-binding protein [Endozoicomonas gorgoniicola]
MTPLALETNLIERIALGDLLRRRSRDTANKTAMVSYSEHGRSTVTYKELNQLSNQLVRGLREQGMVQGDSLALLATNSIEFFAVLFACYKGGFIAIPINFLQAVTDIHYNLSKANVKAVVCEPRFAPLTVDDSLTNISIRVSIGDSEGLTLAQLAAGQDSHDIDDIIIHDRDTAHIIFSSGTTSKPKGVETSHLSMYMASLSNPLSFGFNKYDSQLAVLPTFHCASLSICIMTLQLGGKLVLLPQFEPLNVARVLEAEQIQSTALLPVMWQALLALPNLKQFDFSQLTTGLYGMAPMPASSRRQLKAAFKNCRFHLVSGQSEFTPFSCTFYDDSDTEFDDANYWGVPSMITDQAILDEQGNELPPGQQGEICWRGPLVMNRYLDDVDASRKIREHGWHHTGDLGFIDNCGQLVFVDRKKDMIKSGGENVASVKVEQVLLSAPSVVQVAVFGVPHARWSEAVCAAVQIAPGQPFNEADIIQYCKARLAGFEVPKRIVSVETFPVTATGKIQKSTLKSQYEALFDE